MAVLSSVDSKMVTFLSKTAPDIALHTGTDPSASLTGKADCVNPTCTTTKSKIYILKPEQYNEISNENGDILCSNLYLVNGSVAIFTHSYNGLIFHRTLPVLSLITTVASSCVRLTVCSVVLSLTSNVSCCSTTASFDMLMFTYT